MTQDSNIEKSMKPEIIGYRHVDNILNGGANLKHMGNKKFGDKFLGFIKEITYVHSEGFLTKSLIPIEGSPAKHFRKAIEEAGLVDAEF